MLSWPLHASWCVSILSARETFDIIGWPVKDTNVVLAISRIMVAWQPVGLAMGVYDMANRYLRQREQFGNPLAAYQVLTSAICSSECAAFYDI